MERARLRCVGCLDVGQARDEYLLGVSSVLARELAQRPAALSRSEFERDACRRFCESQEIPIDRARRVDLRLRVEALPGGGAELSQERRGRQLATLRVL